jgi:hypothetical protein
MSGGKRREHSDNPTCTYGRGTGFQTVRLRIVGHTNIMQPREAGLLGILKETGLSNPNPENPINRTMILYFSLSKTNFAKKVT